MKISSITAVKHVNYGREPKRVYEEDQVFLNGSEQPRCPLCADDRSILVRCLIEQIGFWDNVIIAVCHCGWCGDDFACRRIEEGDLDVGEERQQVLPVSDWPELTPKTMDVGNIRGA